MQKLRSIFLFLLLNFVVVAFGQDAKDIPIGTWRGHLSYSKAVSVTVGNGIIYCASSSALFTYNISDGSIDRLNLVNGLSDIGIGKIKFIPSSQKLIVAYTNGNIDLVDVNTNSITNIPFIKESNIIADKTIHNINVSGSLAYLSTGFGIVVLDCNADEIVETYIIGAASSYVNVHSVTFDVDSIYAATDVGVYKASKTASNLADYNYWSVISELGVRKFTTITFFNDQLFVGFDSPTWATDTIFKRNTGVWDVFLSGINIETTQETNSHLAVIEGTNVFLYDQNLNQTKHVYTYKSQFYLSPKEITFDGSYLWIADNNHGLMKMKDNWNGEIIVPNGPKSESAFYIDIVDGKLCLVSGGYGVFINTYPFNVWQNNTWDEGVPQSVYNDYNPNKSRDYVSVAIDPSSPDHMYFGAWDDGLIEFVGNSKVAQYRAQTTPLDSTFFGTTRVSALKFDEGNNLWAVSSYSNEILSVKAASGEWYSYGFSGLTTTASYYSNMVIDDNNYKWIIDNLKNSILVFDDNNSISDLSDDRAVYLSDNTSSIYSIYDANIPGDRMYSIAKDLDGEIWIGTSAGVAVFNNPADVFNQTSQFEQIFIQQDGQTQILLETEIVTAITVDGANRKWFGTQNSGVYLMSEDGSEEIEHFTTENSPLFSNNIYDIKVDGKTGEVYFATEKGLISYKGTATESNEDFNNVFVYPNPVTSGYTGKIAIRGLTKDTDVRITDISGNLVFQTKSFGGQAIWDGNDLNGNRVQTGVYMVFSGGPEGELKNASKILFIK